MCLKSNKDPSKAIKIKIFQDFDTVKPYFFVQLIFSA